MSSKLLTTVPAAKAHHAEIEDYDRQRMYMLADLKEASLKFFVTGHSRRGPDGHYQHHTDPSRGWHAIFLDGHPDPRIRRAELSRRAKLTKLGGRALQIYRTVEALDMTKARHKKWLAHLIDVVEDNRGQSKPRPHGEYVTLLSGYHRTENHRVVDSMFDIHLPYSVPTGIPEGSLTDEEKRRYMIEPSVWEVEQVAALEIEEHMGGLASAYLHGQLTDPGQARLKARATVETYLMRNRQTIPLDPWDPNEWGHDARLKSLTVTEHGRPVTLSPAFDPEVLAYTMNNPVSGAVILSVPNDSFATSDLSLATDRTSATITVTAKDGKTTRAYKITVE